MKIILSIVLIAIGILLIYFIVPMKEITLIVIFSSLAGWCACMLVLSIFGEPIVKAHKEKISKWEKDMMG